MLPQIKESYYQIPQPVKQFGKRALIIIVCWLTIYHVLLQPYNLADPWLTKITTKAASSLLSLVYPASFSIENNTCFITMNAKKILYIADGCNALELFVLYVGFLLCIPTTAKRFIIFSLAGVISIFILNVLRISILSIMAFKSSAYVEFAHHYVFTLIVYSCIFYGWILYCKKYESKAT